MGRYRGSANKDVALSVYTAAIRQWITAPLLFLIRIKIRTAHKPRLEPGDTRSAASYQEFDRTLPRARLVVLRVAELPSHALMLNGWAMPEAIADLTIHFMGCFVVFVAKIMLANPILWRISEASST